MQIIIGLFDEAQEAEHATQSLRENGYDSDITLLHRGDVTTALQMITQSNIPIQDVNFYTEGLRDGGSLVIVRTDNSRSRVAADIMSRFNMVDIDARLSSYTESGKTRIPNISEGVQMGDRQVQRGGMLDSSYAEEWHSSPQDHPSLIGIRPPGSQEGLGALLRSWMQEDAEEQRETLAYLQQALDED